MKNLIKGHFKMRKCIFIIARDMVLSCRILSILFNMKVYDFMIILRDKLIKFLASQFNYLCAYIKL